LPTRCGGLSGFECGKGITMADKQCHCGSGRFFDNCCGPLLTGSRPAATAEELMRSRYTANVVRDTAYLLKSWHSSTQPRTMDPRTIPIWKNLEILNTEQGHPGDLQGMVEFRARYEKDDGLGVLHERSRFVFENGCWFYVDGELIESTPAGPGKTGRNAPCPCGSGRKYKKCCLW